MKNRYLYIVPIITLLIGFIPFLFLSIYYSVFLPKSSVILPLIYNSSIMIGDAFLLPTLNFLIFSIIIRMNDVISQKKKIFLTYTIIAFLISVIMNSIIHIIWRDDFITDFVAFTPGEFSIIGIWHLTFSILQTTIFFIFPLLWYLSIKNRKIKITNKIKKTWIILFIFTLLSILDSVIKCFFIFPDRSLYEVFVIDKFAFATPSISICIFISFAYYENRIMIKDKIRNI